MNKKNILLVYLLLMLMALPVVFFLARTRQENRPSAAGEINLTVAPNTAQILQSSDRVAAHFWINSGNIKMAFVRLSVEFDDSLEVESITNLTEKLLTTVSTTTVTSANNNHKVAIVKAADPAQLDPEENDVPPVPSGALDFMTVTFKKKGESGPLTQNNVRFKKTDIQIVDVDGNEWKNDSITTQGAKYQTSVGSVTNTNTPTPTAGGPTATVTSTKTPTPTSKASPGPLNQIEVTGVVRKVTPCAEYFLCYELRNTSNGTNYYLFSKPMWKVMGIGGEKEPLDRPILNNLKRVMPDICIDYVVDEPTCKERLARITNFDQYVGKTVTVKGYTNVLNGKRFIAVSSIKVVSETPTATKSPTPTTSVTPTPTYVTGQTLLKMYPETNSKNINQEFTGDILVYPGNNKVSAIELVLKFDPNYVSFKSLNANTNNFPNVLQATQINNTDGTARITLGATTALTGNQDFGVATFYATTKGTAGGSKISITNASRVAAIGTSQNVLSGTTELNLTIVANNGLKGDIDQDDDVDIFDYNLLLENFGKTDCGNIADIVKTDGICKVDIFDYNLLLENFGETI